MPRLTVSALPGLPEVVEGDELADLLTAAAAAAEISLGAGDVVVVSSKIVSKAAGLRATGDRAAAVARHTKRVVAERAAGDHVTRIVEATAGPVMAAAGVDASNVGAGGDLLLLPEDPDAEAARLRSGLIARLGLPRDAALGVIVSDTAGRPWRSGQVDFALGAAGVRVLADHRGSVDHDGRPMDVTVRCIADELASAADLVKGKADHLPVAVVSGCPPHWFDPENSGAQGLVRTGPSDWFSLGHVEAVRAALGVEPGSATAAAVGIPPVGGPGELPGRVARVVALALDVDDVAADVEVGADQAAVTLSGPADVAVGRALGRLEVAAWSEALAVAVSSDGSATNPVSVRLTPVGPASKGQ